MSDMELDMEETMQGIIDARGEDDQVENLEDNLEGVDVSRETEPEPEVEVDPEPEPIAEPEPEVDPNPEPEPEPEFQSEYDLTNPPRSWTAGSKAKWGELPEWARHEAMKRETDMENGARQLYQKAAFGDRINQTLTPYMPIIKAEGGTPETAVESMLNLAYTLRQGSIQEKLQLVGQVAQQYGFFDQLKQALAVENSPNSGQNSQQMYDPRVDELQRELQNQRLSQQEAQESEAFGTVQAFITATNEDGTLKYPYFENVKTHMATLYESGQYEDLEGAYDAAVWANPETRQLVIAQQASQNEAERQAEAKERARKAKEADKLNVSEGGTHTPQQSDKPTGSVGDTMHEVMSDIRARA